MVDERTIRFSKSYPMPPSGTKCFAKAAGREVIEQALQLFYAAQYPEAPAWAKTVIYGALARRKLDAEETRPSLT